jgi:hypothetical protein
MTGSPIGAAAPVSGSAPAGRTGVLWGLLGWLGQWVRLLWLCGYAVVAFAFGSYFFLLNDQGLDFLRRLGEGFGGEPVAPDRLFFFLGVLAWALATWYSTRQLLKRCFRGIDQAFFDGTRKRRRWLPRLGGALVPVVIAGGFLRAAAEVPQGAGPLRVLAGLYVLLGVVLLGVLWGRRTVLQKMRVKVTAPEDCDRQLPPGSLAVIWVSSALSWGLLAAFLLSPVGLPAALGAPAILLFALASWILFGGMVVTYWPLSAGYPAFTLPLLLLALVASGFNDNHTVRTVRSDAATAEPAAGVPGKLEGPQTVDGRAEARPMPAAHFQDWLEATAAPGAEPKPRPVFLVAAAGGGIRAAYWTASVLGRIADQAGPGWGDHLYALSGVSGGSVASALHAVQIAERLEGGGAGRAGYLEEARRTLAADLLSPVFAYLLFPDAVQRFVPIPFPAADRARALDLALEAAVAGADGVASGRFQRPFLDLWAGPAGERLPALLLNTTVVETGQRGIVSNLRIDKSFTDAVDVLATPTGVSRAPLSTAAHLSARFTYVSPAGTLRREQDGRVWGRLVDGGYFENSGTATAAELAAALQELILELGSEARHKPIINMIIIRNDPAAPRLCDGSREGSLEPRPHAALNDLLSPVRALLNTRTARGRLAELDAAGQVARWAADAPECTGGCVFEFALTPAADDVEAPLGWSLSRASREAMDRQLEAHAVELACIEELVRTGRCRNPPPCELGPRPGAPGG